MFNFAAKPPLHARSKSGGLPNQSVPIPTTDNILSPLPRAFAPVRGSPSRKTHLRTQTESAVSNTYPSSSSPIHYRALEERRGIEKSIVITTCFSGTQDINFNFSPHSSPPPSPRLLPTKERWSFMSKKAEDKTPAKLKLDLSSLESWFSGESEPLNIGIIPSPKKEKVQDPLTTNPMASFISSPSSFETRSTITRSQLSNTTPSSRPVVASTFGRFSFFGSSPKLPPTPANAPLSTSLADEFTSLDIKTALQPSGQLDPFSPSSFKNLLQNAEGILSRLQTAYRQRTLILQETLAEKEAQADELDEASTRAKHLKIQLDQVSERAATQESELVTLRRELEKEKIARKEAEKRTVRMVLQDDALPHMKSTRRKKDRVSLSNSDSGFESEAESVVDSLFKIDHAAAHGSLASAVSINSVDTPASLHGGTGFEYLDAGEENRRQGFCTRCRGETETEVEDMLDMFRAENQGLKARVRDLECSLEGCLDLVGALGM
ncbi:hypothetical protein MMC25_008055 [Agyrium rufum]|nr:hypothetical protein [Agyrium rufum]